MEIALNYISIMIAVFIFGALAAMVSERAGVINLGVNGMMIIGALIYAIFGFFTVATNSGNNNLQFLAVFIAGIAGMIFAALYAFSAVTLRANQIVGGTAINLLAQGIGLLAVRARTWDQANQITSHFRDITAGPINVYFIIAIIVGFIIFFALNFSKFGLRYISVGENPNASDAAGINVTRYRYTAVLLSGFLAGIAGALFNVLTAQAFYGNVQGTGYIALAVMIFGQWRTLIIVVASFFFGILRGLAFSQTITTLPIAAFNAIPFAASILALLVTAKANRMPAADGQPFIKSKR